RHGSPQVTTTRAHDLRITFPGQGSDSHTGVVGGTMTEPHRPRRVATPGLEEVEPTYTVEPLIRSVQRKVHCSSGLVIHSAHCHIIAPSRCHSTSGRRSAPAQRRHRLGAVATCYPLRALDQGVMSTQCPLVDTVPAGGSPTTRLLGTSSSEQGTHSTMIFIPVRNHG